MTAKELKASILDLAVRGKLVPQDPNDEPASVLLEKIRAEKQKLIKAGKIKKEKNTSEIYIASDGRPYEKFADGSETCIEDEIPFELPTGWAWCRWTHIAQTIQYGYNAPALETGTVRMVRISDIQANGIEWDNVPFCEIDDVSAEKYRLNSGDILFARTGGTVGKSYLVEDVPFDSVYAGYLIRTKCWPTISPKYAKVFLESEFYWEQLRDGVVATAQPNCNGQKLSAMILPLPPLSEQHRIVAKIEELMTKVGEYENAAQQLTEFKARFSADLKKSILQAAAEGKLVPQDPNDEPASVLLEKIRAEKQKLIKTGRLKRDKHESVIFRGSDRLTYETRDGETVCIEDELPFKIPKSWAWVRLGSVATIIRGSGIKRDEIVPVGLPCIRYGELYTTYQTRIDAVISHTTESVASRAKSIKHDDVILTLTGENKEDIGMAAAYLGKDDAVVGGDVAVLKDHHCDPLWLSYFLAAPFAVGQKAGMSNGDIIVHLSVQSVASIMVPLPPLAEQKRIVAQIEKMLKVSAALTT